MQRCSRSHSTHRRCSFHARQIRAAQLRQPVRATATSAAAGSDVELAATVGHLISWLTSSGASVTNRLEPKRFKADVGERVGLIAAVDAAAGKKMCWFIVVLHALGMWQQRAHLLRLWRRNCKGPTQRAFVGMTAVSTVHAQLVPCQRTAWQLHAPLCLASVCPTALALQAMSTASNTELITLASKQQLERVCDVSPVQVMCCWSCRTHS
jgi:hypothetical protein